MLDDELATIRLFRFDPAIDTVPRYDDFNVPYKGSTVLSVLSYIHDKLR